MKPGDLYRVVVPPDVHPRDDYLNGMIVVILGKKYKPSSIPGEYVKGLGIGYECFRLDGWRFYSETWRSCSNRYRQGRL